MEFKNAKKRMGIDRQSRAMLPTKDQYASLGPGRYVRLMDEAGNCLWARCVRRYGDRLVLTSADTLPSGSLRIGDEVCTSVAAVFAVI